MGGARDRQESPTARFSSTLLSETRSSLTPSSPRQPASQGTAVKVTNAELSRLEDRTRTTFVLVGGGGHSEKHRLKFKYQQAGSNQKLCLVNKENIKCPNLSAIPVFSKASPSISPSEQCITPPAYSFPEFTSPKWQEE